MACCSCSFVLLQTKDDTTCKYLLGLPHDMKLEMKQKSRKVTIMAALSLEAVRVASCSRLLSRGRLCGPIMKALTRIVVICCLLSLITLPVFDEICRRSLRFIMSCVVRGSLCLGSFCCSFWTNCSPL